MVGVHADLVAQGAVDCWEGGPYASPPDQHLVEVESGVGGAAARGLQLVDLPFPAVGGSSK